MNLNIDLIRFFDNTPDLVCIAGRDGYFKNINQAVMQTLGYTRQELFAHPISHFVHPADAALTARKRNALLKGEALLDFENRYLTKKGDTVWLHWTSVYFAESGVVFAIAKNITGRKQKEQGLEERFAKLKTLVSHFKSSLEKDKKLLAGELHDWCPRLKGRRPQVRFRPIADIRSAKATPPCSVALVLNVRTPSDPNRSEPLMERRSSAIFAKVKICGK
jgi:PAS domain S-box-containing protein